MKPELASEILHPNQHKHLSPTGIAPVIESYSRIVWDALEKEGSRVKGASTPLLDFALPVIYQASAYAFFGRSCPTTETYEPFRDFDRKFHLALAGVPRFFLGEHAKGLATLQKLFEVYMDGPHDDASELVLENERVLRSHNHVRLLSTVLMGNLGLSLMIELGSRIRRPSALSSFHSSSP